MSYQQKKNKKEDYIKESVPEYIWLIRRETVSDNVLKKTILKQSPPF